MYGQSGGAARPEPGPGCGREVADARARGPGLRRRAARLLLAAAVVAGLAVGGGVGWVLLDGPSDPDRLIEQPLPDLTAATVLPYAGAGCGRRRLCQDVILDPAGARPVRIALSLPRDRGPAPLPAVILAGGLRAGREALRYVAHPGRNAVVTYQYPLDPERWRHAFLPVRIVAARRAALAVPGQLAAVLRWTRAQPWADPERVSLVGVSLGALVLPAAERVAAAHGASPAPCILAYGGTDLGAILGAEVAPDRPWLGAAIAWLGNLGLRALEPAAHLPHLAGPFLLINGTDDPRIPAASAAGLQRLTPEPKELRILPAGHIDTDDQALLDEILAIARSWLVRRGALNPAARRPRRSVQPRIVRRRSRLAAGHSSCAS